ncbi:unnamed protein product [Boreogadus saida]
MFLLTCGLHGKMKGFAFLTAFLLCSCAAQDEPIRAFSSWSPTATWTWGGCTPGITKRRTAVRVRTKLPALFHRAEPGLDGLLRLPESVLKGLARGASSLLRAAEALFARYRVSLPDGPVASDGALARLRALRWAVSEVTSPRYTWTVG